MANWSFVDSSGLPRVASDNAIVVDAFAWAVRRALSLVQTGRRGVVDRHERSPGGGDKPYVPCYWAGYLSRTAFYSRDFCHQASGAHLVGLERENRTMLQAFAGTATPERRGFPLWAINFDGSPFRLDWRNDEDFVREVPAVFELVELAWRLFRWTGDRFYVDDPILRAYGEQALGAFVRWHDGRRPNGIAEGDGSGDIFSGSATYNEVHADHPLVEAGDGVACQWAGTDAWARLLAARGDRRAKAMARRAAELRRHIHTVWGVTPNFPGWVRGYDVDGRAWTDFGLENSWFLPMKGAVDPGRRTEHLLDLIDRSVADPDTRPSNLEAISYLPGVFFPWGRVETAWRWLRHLMTAPDRSYPEISYTIVSHTVEGLCGVEPDMPRRRVATCPRLPREIAWIEVEGIRIGDAALDVRLEGATGSSATLAKGTVPLVWEARLATDRPTLMVNGQRRPARRLTINGVRHGAVDITLEIGKRATVSL